MGWYIFSTLFSVILLFAIAMIWKYYDSFCSNENKYMIHAGKRRVIYIGVFVLLFGSSCLLLWRKVEVIDYLKIMLVLVCILSSAWIDVQVHKIPNRIMFFSFLAGIGLLGADFIWRREIFLRILFSSVFGLFFFSVFLFVVAVLTKHALGYGDVKLFAVIGFVMGFTTTYNILVYSLIVCALWSLYLILIKKKGRKYSMPFGPFVLFGYMIAILFGGY